MNSGTSLEKIKRLFNYLEENKTNNDLQIIMTTEGCRDLYELFISFNKYQKILEERIDKAIEYIENDMPYLEEPDKEFEDCDGETYMTMKKYDTSILLNILNGE